MIMGAAATGAYMGLQERSAEQIAMDTKVKIHIKDKLTNANYKYFGEIGVTVFEGDVLLTGVVESREEGEKILAITRGTPDVKRVYNELFVGSGYSASQRAQDTWIFTQIKARLMGNRETFPINYAVDVVNSHVYIMGYVLEDEEHEHVLHILRTTKGVTQVHDYLRLSSSGEDPRKKEAIQTNLKKEAPAVLPEDPFRD
jgi:hyperosmotically inducible protein